MSETKPWWTGDIKFCQNRDCPNNHIIEVMAFRQTGFCSDDCRKQAGMDFRKGVQYLVDRVKAVAAILRPAMDKSNYTKM